MTIGIINFETNSSLEEGCKSREIKHCAELATAEVIDAPSPQNLFSYELEKYGAVTPIDFSSLLDIILSSNHRGNLHFFPEGQPFPL
ncbi:hypothetical protein PIB30_035339 [Stylosanthes scabra]|uniref:Uncharacterized protein n=1 Tax=Stylosanthes scabra TaxID=79078 RepID=A0ABU6UBU3_9FABA|nr:hypothetical protein [Stylosanthes scabra]